MRYLVRLNPRAINALTLKINPKLLWEVEQASSRDSETVVWHCADVKVDGRHIREVFELPKQGEKPWQMEYYGVCTRGQDDAIEIKTGPKDASGN